MARRGNYERTFGRCLRCSIVGKLGHFSRGVREKPFPGGPSPYPAMRRSAGIFRNGGVADRLGILRRSECITRG